MSGKVIAITGGIGSGKSIVSCIVRALGYDVFDCDSEARRIMDNDEALKTAIDRDVAPGCLLPDGALDRRLIASVVFSDDERLRRLNALVHGAVTRQLEAWIASRRHAGKNALFFETAIPRSSRLDSLADVAWEVTAPEDVRIERVMKRSGLTAIEAKARIEAQRAESLEGASEIVNDGYNPVLPQVETLLKSL